MSAGLSMPEESVATPVTIEIKPEESEATPAGARGDIPPVAPTSIHMDQHQYDPVMEEPETDDF